MQLRTQQNKFKDNPYFGRYLNLLIQLHGFMRLEDEERADAIREQMDEPGYHLSPEEIRWLKGVSADLYMLANSESFITSAGSPQQVMNKLKEASDRNDGETMLELLRGASFVSSEHRAWFRSRAYDLLGYYSLAQLFLAFAADKRPDAFEYKYMLLAKTMGQGNFEEAKTLASEFAKVPNQHPMLKILIAVALYRSTEALPVDEATPFLEQALDVAKSVASEGVDIVDVVMKWMVLGVCYYRLGDIDNALVADSEAVDLDPDNANSLEIRAKHKLQFDYNGALADFQRAIELNTPLPLPYLFIIRENLRREEYEAAKVVCNRLLALHRNNRVRAQAYEFLAIAYYGLRRPLSEVQRAYGNALRLSFSERRRQNFQALTIGSMGLVSKPQILLPLLTVEELEAFEDSLEEEEEVMEYRLGQDLLVQQNKSP